MPSKSTSTRQGNAAIEVPDIASNETLAISKIEAADTHGFGIGDHCAWRQPDAAAKDNLVTLISAVVGVLGINWALGYHDFSRGR